MIVGFKTRDLAPPAVVSTLPVIATAAGNAQDPDHVIPSLLPRPRPSAAARTTCR